MNRPTRTLSLLATLSILALGAQADPESAGALGPDLFLGKPVVAENVTVWPVYSNSAAEPLPDQDFIPLEEAQAKKWAIVRETGAPNAATRAAQSRNARPAQNQPVPNLPAQNPAPPGPNPPAQPEPQNPPADPGPPNQAVPPQPRAEPQIPVPNPAAQQIVQADVGGSVNELVIENVGEKPILVLAGTVLKGGKQDRQIAQDFIVPPKKTVPVGAYCIEHGRWTATRDGVENQGLFLAQKSLSNADVRLSGQYKESQQEVWSNVAATNGALGNAPASGTLLATIEDGDKDAVARRARLQKAVRERFEALAKEPKAPSGLAYAVDGKVREIRTFTHPRVFARYVETLSNTIALEGDIAQRKAVAAKAAVFDKPAEAKQVTELVQATANLKEEQTRNRAGNDARFRKGEKAWNSETRESPKAAPATKSWAQ